MKLHRTPTHHAMLRQVADGGVEFSAHGWFVAAKRAAVLERLCLHELFNAGCIFASTTADATTLTTHGRLVLKRWDAEQAYAAMDETAGA